MSKATFFMGKLGIIWDRVLACLPLGREMDACSLPKIGNRLIIWINKERER